MQGENANSQQQQNVAVTTAAATLHHTSHTTNNNVINAIKNCHSQSNALPPTLPKNQIPIPPHVPNTIPHIISKYINFIEFISRRYSINLVSVKFSFMFFNF